MSRRKKSYLTVTDQFCGAGGSSIGAAAAGLEIRMAMNHWKLAVETHNTNFPDADHDCADVSATDPRRYPTTDILITSPECTTHSPAGGNRHKKSSQQDFFIPTETDPATQRSRATMWDVVRFAEYHDYRAIIVENVVEAVRTWSLFWTWWQAMENLGYVGQIVSLNSMFALPTPQSRDRIYIVWTKDKKRKPDLNITPTAHCTKCGDVEARQTWKTGRSVGKYGQRNQYVYTCPTCRSVVMPYYFCALNAIDFSIPATRIGDRKKPLKERTRARVQYGLDTYGNRPLMITPTHGSGLECRVKEVTDVVPTQPTARRTALLTPPWMVSAGSQDFATPSSADVAPTATASERAGIAGLSPWLVSMLHSSQSVPSSVRPVTGPAQTQTTAEEVGLAFTPFITTNRTNGKARSLTDVVPALCAGGEHHALITPAAIVRLMGPRPVDALDAPARAQTTGADQNLIVSTAPYLIQYYGNGNASSADEGVPAITTKDRHALIEPGRQLTVDDCFFRMFAAHEVGATMAFPGTYTVLGNKSEQIMQFGNAVTPPAMKKLIRRVVQYIAGERWLPVRAA